jgi:hypothetical protein
MHGTSQQFLLEHDVLVEVLHTGMKPEAKQALACLHVPDSWLAGLNAACS